MTTALGQRLRVARFATPRRQSGTVCRTTLLMTCRLLRLLSENLRHVFILDRFATNACRSRVCDSSLHCGRLMTRYQLCNNNNNNNQRTMLSTWQLLSSGGGGRPSRCCDGTHPRLIAWWPSSVFFQRL